METEEVVCVAIDIHKTKEGYEQSNSYITVFEIENLKEINNTMTTKITIINHGPDGITVTKKTDSIHTGGTTL